MPVVRVRGFRRDLVPRLAELLEGADHYTYAIWDGGYLKIGKSSGYPQERLADLQTGNPRGWCWWHTPSR
jgi:hypothetical protein